MTPAPELPGADWAEWLADVLEEMKRNGHVCGPACQCEAIANRPEVAEVRRKRGPAPVRCHEIGES